MVSMSVPYQGKDGRYQWNFTQVVHLENPYMDDMIEITLSGNIDQELRIQDKMPKKEKKAKVLLEKALQKKEKARKAKSQFLSRMSHDIRTPMNVHRRNGGAGADMGSEEKMKDLSG